MRIAYIGEGKRYWWDGGSFVEDAEKSVDVKEFPDSEITSAVMTIFRASHPVSSLVGKSFVFYSFIHVDFDSLNLTLNFDDDLPCAVIEKPMSKNKEAFELLYELIQRPFTEPKKGGKNETMVGWK